MLRSMVPSPLCALFLVTLPACSDPSSTPEPPKPIPVLVVSGANNHDWQWTTPSLARILEASGRFEVDVTYEPAAVFADEAERSKYRAFVLDYNGPSWGDAAHQGFLASVEAGTGVVVIHAANNSGNGWPEYEKLVGDLWRKGTGHGRFHSFDVAVTDRDHPVTRTLPTMLKHPDELYHRLVNVHDVDRRVLATAFSDPETGGTGENEPMILVRNHGKGRVFHTPLGHVWKGNLPSQASHNDPQFRGLFVRGTEWAATGKVRDQRTAPKPLTAGQKTAGWRSLMDKDAWRSASGGDVPAGWRFGEGVIQRTDSAGDLVTTETYEDFELEWQWKTTIAGNSGVKYRFRKEGERSVGPEYQLLDAWGDVKSDEHRAGALYDVAKAQGAPEGLWGEFHRARVVARGTRLEHWLDGVKVMEIDTASPAWAAALEDSKFKGVESFAAGAGQILLQDHGDEAWIRGMRIRPLTGDAAAENAARDDAASPLFGESGDLAAWGNVGDATYRVEGDLLIGNAGPRRLQSFLVSKETFHDFELNVGVKIEVLGNSGIQIRSHVNPKGRLQGYQAEIDPTERSWSAGIYDEGRRGWINDLKDNRAAREAFDLEGWNEYRIRCEGTRIRTWVNGVPAADLLDGADISGSLAFQIHGGDDDIEIRWRNARIQRLGAHDWRSADDGTFGDATAVRARVSGDGARALLVGAKDRSIKLSKTKYWHQGGVNTITLLRSGDRAVLQVNDRTIFDDEAKGLSSLDFEKADSVEGWTACRPVPAPEK